MQLAVFHLFNVHKAIVTVEQPMRSAVKIEDSTAIGVGGVVNDLLAANAWIGNQFQK